MKRASLTIVMLIVIAGLLVAGGAFFIVNEAQQVVITQFGRPVGDSVTTPGLKFKIPVLQKTNYFEKRFLEWDGDPNQVPTRDKRFIWVDTYARWRITDPLLFFQRLRDELGAQSRLDDILDGETRSTIAKHNLIEAVRSSNRTFPTDELYQGDETFEEVLFGREVLEQEVLDAARQRVEEADLGLEILDFRFKRLNYVEEVRREVYSRMISERQRIAEQYRSEGAGEAARINGDKDLPPVPGDPRQGRRRGGGHLRPCLQQGSRFLPLPEDHGGLSQHLRSGHPVDAHHQRGVPTVPGEGKIEF